MRIDADAPGEPDCDVTTTPGAFAARAETTLVSFDRWITPESTGVRTVPMRSAAVAVPAPVTTSSPSWRGLVTRVKSWLTVLPLVSVTDTRTGRKPSRRASSVALWPVARAPGTVDGYRPSSCVRAPSEKPTIATVAFGSG